MSEGGWVGVDVHPANRLFLESWHLVTRRSWLLLQLETSWLQKSPVPEQGECIFPHGPLLGSFLRFCSDYISIAAGSSRSSSTASPQGPWVLTLHPGPLSHDPFLAPFNPGLLSRSCLWPFCNESPPGASWVCWGSMANPVREASAPQPLWAASPELLLPNTSCCCMEMDRAGFAGVSLTLLLRGMLRDSPASLWFGTGRTCLRRRNRAAKQRRELLFGPRNGRSWERMRATKSRWSRWAVVRRGQRALSAKLRRCLTRQDMGELLPAEEQIPFLSLPIL